MRAPLSVRVPPYSETLVPDELMPFFGRCSESVAVFSLSKFDQEVMLASVNRGEAAASLHGGIRAKELAIAAGAIF